MNKSTYKELRNRLNFNFKPFYFYTQVGVDLSFLAIIGYTFTTKLALLNVLIIPLFMFRQFSIMHEAVHGLTHRNSKINFAFGIMSGVFCVTPFAVWKAAHMKHHYWTGNLEQDPTFSILKSFKNTPEKKQNLIQQTWKIGFPFLGYLQHLGFWNYLIKNFNVQEKSKERWLSLILPVCFYSSLILQLSWINLLITSIGILFYFRLYEDMIVPQHVGLYSNDDADMRSPSWEQVEISRTWILPSFIEKLVVLNMNYHTEHHVFPDLPWHELEKAHILIKDSSEGQSLNIITLNWMSNQRQRAFEEVIKPVPTKKNKLRAS